MRKALLVALFGPLLSACSGGGSDDSAIPVRIDATALRVFADGDGAGKLQITTADGVRTGYVLTPELTRALQEIEATGEVTPIDISTLPVVGSGPNTQIRQGAVTIDGFTANALAVVTTGGDAVLAIIEDPSSGLSILTTEGDRAVALPVSGSATYSGLITLQDVYFDPAPELGTFSAMADFQNGTVDFDGSTASYRTSGTAIISGNSFTSGAMTIEDQPFAIVESGTLQGDFHGRGGTSMGGIIYSNDSFATYRGGFVGSR